MYVHTLEKNNIASNCAPFLAEKDIDAACGQLANKP